MVTKLIISLSITAFISTLIGLIVISHFLIAFILSFVAQIAFFYVFNTIYENKTLLDAQRLKNEELKEKNKQIAVIECPCNEKYKQEVDMRFDRDIVYTCLKCEKNIKADITVKAAMTTQPIYFNDRS